MTSLIITFLAGISVLIGALIVRATNNSDKVGHFSIAMGTAALLALIVVDLFPDLQEEAVEALGIPLTVVFVIAGMLLLHILDRFTPDHGHSHGSLFHKEEEGKTEDEHFHLHEHDHEHIGLVAAAAIIIHNIVEGMSVYSLSMVNTHDGALFALGIALHNIPMGMLIYSTMCDAKQARHEKAIVISAVTLSTFVGGLLMFFISSLMTPVFVGILLCLACGMIFYIAFEELLPHVIKTKEPLINITGILAGFCLVYLSSVIG